MVGGFGPPPNEPPADTRADEAADPPPSRRSTDGTARVAADTTFRFQLDESSSAGSTPMQNMSMQDMMAMMNGGGDGGITSAAKGPEDFALVKLVVADENRQAHFGSVGASHPKDAVDFTVEKLGPHAFRVKPKHALAPGEYAFYVRMGNAPMGQAWDFGVDQK